jgi:hypothetical protein
MDKDQKKTSKKMKPPEEPTKKNKTAKNTP